MIWIKSFFKIIVIAVSFIVLLIIFFIARFFVINDAPILSGEVDRHIEYKEGLKLDIYLPTQQVFSETPVVIYFHGGAWVMGDKMMVNLNRFNSAINALRDKGYAIVAPEYSLANDSIAPFPAAIYDVRDAIQWVIENHVTYNFDTKNLGILAESAGAQLAMMAIYTNNCGQQHFTDSLQMFTYFVDAYAPVELNKLFDAGVLDSMQLAIQKFPKFMQRRMNFIDYLFDFDPSIDPIQTNAYLTKYSPINYVNKNVPPTLFVHGKTDFVVPVEQSLLLKQRLDELNIYTEVLLLEDVSHVLRGATEEQHQLVQQTIVRFIEKNYRF